MLLNVYAFSPLSNELKNDVAPSATFPSSKNSYISSFFTISSTWGMGRLYMLWLSLLRRVNEILALFMVSLICSSLYILSMGSVTSVNIHAGVFTNV